MPESNCLAGCINNYFCAPLHQPGPAGKQAESFSPIVKIKIGSETLITVGNESFPANPHTAVIKSFEIGWVDSMAMSVEILDEAGGRFGAFVDGLAKCATYIGPSAVIESEWGWVYSTCDGQKNTIISPKCRSVFAGMEVNYSEGKIKYKITGTGLDPIYADMREDKVFGESAKKIKLEDAIVQLCAIDPPIQVDFCEIQPDGKLKCGRNMFNWEKSGKGGPEGVFQCDSLNRIPTIAKWLEPFRINDGSEKGKGVVLIIDPRNYDRLIVLKDPTLDPGESRTCSAADNLGTFIVNGGKCSSVIEFTPKWNFVSGFANFNSGGDTGSAATSRSVYAEDAKQKNQEQEHGKNVGLQQQTTITQQAWEAYGPKNAHEEVLKSQQRHNKANRMLDVGVATIEADLKILGDPRPQFVDLQGWMSKKVSIVAINPFHISGDVNAVCGEWLAKPGCNKWLSNKSWRVQAMNHSISEGSYTTTMKIQLESPGIEVGHKDPLGGQGSGGPTVKNTCG